MKDLIIKEILRNKLLMWYDSSKTYSDNLNEQNPVYPKEVFMTDDQIKAEQERQKKEKNKEIANTYPNYCTYKDKAVWPTENPAGASGKDALIKDHCLYLTPNKSGIWLHKDAIINFWSIDKISNAVDFFIKNYSLKKDERTKNFWIQGFSEAFPLNTVRNFKTFNDIGGKKFTDTFNTSYEPDYYDYKVKFLWYYNENKEPYRSPNWVDERGEYDRFIDQWGFALQITSAIATLIAGFLTGGAAWVVYLEIVLEGTLGVATGLREWEKGENVGAALSLLTGFLPIGKLVPGLRGVNPSHLKSLSKALAESKLSITSQVSDYVKFYNKLPPPQQKILAQLLEYDELTRKKLLKELENEMILSSNKLYRNSFEMVDDFKIAVKKNPELLKDLKFFEKLWARELTANLGVFGFLTLLNIAFGDKLNSKDKERLSGVYQKIPDQLKKEFTLNLFQNNEKISEIVKSEEITKIITTSTEGFSKNASKWYKIEIKKLFENAGGKYFETPESPKIESVVVQDEKKIRDEGWIPSKEFDINKHQWYDEKLINGQDWIKIKEL